MSYRVFQPFLILTSVFLLQNHVLLASDDQREENKQVPRRVSDAEAFERFINLQKSQGIARLSLAKVPVAVPSVVSSPKTRVRFGDSTILRYEAVESPDLSDPESQSAITASSSSDIIVLSDQLASTTLDDSLHKRPRSSSVTDASKTLQKKRTQTNLNANALVPFPMDIDTRSVTAEAEMLALPFAPVTSPVSTDAETTVRKSRTRVKKRSLSTNESHRQKTIRSLLCDEELGSVPQNLRSPRAESSISDDTIESPRPLSPRVLEEGKAPPSNSLYSSLMQSMFYVPEMKSYYKTTSQLTATGQHSVIQEALGAIGRGEQGYKYKIDFTTSALKTVEGRIKATVYPLIVYKNSQKLFTLECYQTKEGPVNNIEVAIKKALKQSDVNPHYGFSKDSTLVVTQYREDITEEDRTIFVHFKSSFLDTLKKHPFDVIGVSSFSWTHTYETNKGDINCFADLVRAGYSYYMFGRKNNDFIGFIRVSSYPSVVEQQATSSTPVKVSSSTSSTRKR
jgi:hypothetical protein